MKEHGGRAHSKFSASGAERWTACSASVELSEGMPDKATEWSLEGTKAHEILESIMRGALAMKSPRALPPKLDKATPREMGQHALEAANFILGLGHELKAEVLVETRIRLDFIHPEMFGTFDGAVLDYFGTLHVFDFKYGAGHAVRPENNLQMVFYALGLAHQYQYNFEKVRVWIIQPRIRGYDGPRFWDLSIDELKGYVKVFTDAVERVENNPTLNEGAWCHWCKAKSKCPVKTENKRMKTIDAFRASPITTLGGGFHGFKEKGGSRKGAGKKEDEEKRLAKKGWRQIKSKTEGEDFY